MIRPVGVQAPLDGTRGNLQSPAPSPGFNGFEVQPLQGAWADQRPDLRGDLGSEGFSEPPFLAASSSEAALGADTLASQSCSLVSTSSRISVRNRRYSSNCRRVCSTAPEGITRVTVLPPTARVKDQLGP
jgi:hypothetical protein